MRQSLTNLDQENDKGDRLQTYLDVIKEIRSSESSRNAEMAAVKKSLKDTQKALNSVTQKGCAMHKTITKKQLQNLNLDDMTPFIDHVLSEDLLSAIKQENQEFRSTYEQKIIKLQQQLSEMDSSKQDFGALQLENEQL